MTSAPTGGRSALRHRRRERRLRLVGALLTLALLLATAFVAYLALRDAEPPSVEPVGRSEVPGPAPRVI